MKRILVSILGATLLLTACSTSHQDDGQSNSSHKAESDKHQTKDSSHHSTKTVQLKQLLDNPKEQLIVTLKNDSVPSEKVSNNDFIKHPKDSLKKFSITNIGYIKDGQGYNYSDKINDQVSFDQLVSTDVSDIDRKLTKLTEYEMNHGINDDQNKVNIKYEPSDLKTILYTKKGDALKEDVQLADYQREMNMSGDIGEEKTDWLSNHNKIDEDGLKSNFPQSSDYEIEPFEYKGKTFAGFAKLTSDVDNDNQPKIDQYISELTLVEVPKNTKVTKDDKDDVTKVIDYNDTDSGKQEKDKENHSFDNL